LNSERKSFAAFVATAALLLSSVPALFAVPAAQAATFVPGSGGGMHLDAPRPFGLGPTLIPTPGLGPKGTSVQVVASGFTGAELITTTFASSGVVTPTVVVTGNADANGVFTGTFTVPSTSTIGTAQLTASGAITTDFGTFVVLAPSVLTVVPNNSDQGVTQPVTVTGSGFLPSASTVNVTFTAANGVTATAVTTADVTGLITAVVTIPSTAGAGVGTFSAVDNAGNSSTTNYVVNAVAPPPPGLVVSPTIGVPLETATLTGTSFAPNSTVTILFAAPGGIGFQIGTAATDGNGGFSTSVQIPSGARPVTDTITASDPTGHSSVANFVVLTPTIFYAGQTGPGGTFVSGVTGSGFSANVPVSVTLAPTGTTTAVVTNTPPINTDPTGAFTLPTGSLQVPSGQAPGVYQIVATDANGIQATSASSAAQPFTVTTLAATGNASLGRRW
jgi:hypothetical protein